MAARPSSNNSHLTPRKTYSINTGGSRLSSASSCDGPVAKMQQLRIVSSAFLGSAPSKCPATNEEDESSESDTRSGNDFSDSSTEDFQTESEPEKSSDKVMKTKSSTPWPGASGDATNESERVFQQDGERKPPLHRNSSVRRNIQDVLKTLQDTLKNVDASATRPATPTVGPSDKEERLESRGSGDTYVRSSKWAEWFVKKEFDKKRQEESERKKRAEIEQRAMQEERRNQVLVGFQQWRQRKDAQREAREKAQAMRLEQLRQEEKERLLAMEEISKRAVAEWFRNKDRELKERRLSEEKNKAEAKEKEKQRRAAAEKRVREWRRLRAGPCALNASRFVNPQPWVNIVEIPEEEPETKAATPRPRRRTRREQERICARLSRPKEFAAKESEKEAKMLVPWIQRVKRRSHGGKPSEPVGRCVSARPPSRENLEIILSHSEYKSPASRTSDWIKSVISRRYEQEGTGKGNVRRKTQAPKEVSKLSENDRKTNVHRAPSKDHTNSQKSKAELNLKKRTETR